MKMNQIDVNLLHSLVEIYVYIKAQKSKLSHNILRKGCDDDDLSKTIRVVENCGIFTFSI